MLLPSNPSCSASPSANADVPLNLRILVVDDDTLVRQLVSRQLMVFGYEVTAVPGAREALAELSSKSYDLMLTDWHMEDIDGCELVRTTRRLGHRLPIIFCSGWINQEPLPEDVASEIAATLQKPARADELMLAIWNAI